MSSDGLFFALPEAIQNKIDSAFNSIAKKRVVPSDTATGRFIPETGGFLRDDQDYKFGGGFMPDQDAGGGFIHEGSEGGGFVHDPEEPSLPDQIPLSMIPSALQILDLPPDDDEILAVFRNAATGWASGNNRVGAGRLEAEEQYVSRDDWRSVCGVLLEHDLEDSKSDGDVGMADSKIHVDDASDSDAYHESELGDGEEDDDDEYIEGPSVRRRTRQVRKSSSLSPPRPSLASQDSRSNKLTSRQRQTAIDAYALFFPSAAPEELLNQKIMIKDVQRVAKLLNEKLKLEEVHTSTFCTRLNLIMS